MTILAIETASQVSSAAIWKEGRRAAELIIQGRLVHSETLMPHIETVMQMADVRREDLSGIAASIGPGSFTGLRIGLATAKAMAYALNIPIVGVPTLDALAVQMPVPSVRITCLMDAQKGNVYRASYEFDAGNALPKNIKSCAVMPIESVLEECREISKPVYLFGDIVQKKLTGDIRLPDNTYIAPPHLIMPRAACVAFLGARRLSRGESDGVMELSPHYIRRSEAEVLWEKRHGA